MKHFVNALSWTLRWTGITWLARSIMASGKVTLINYHNPSTKTFSEHLAYFSKEYSIISLDRLYEALRSGNFSNLPAKPMVITIDDGHAGNAVLADCIRRFQVPVTIYLVSGIIDTDKKFWFKHPGLNFAELQRLKRLPNSERLRSLESFEISKNDKNYENHDRHALSYAEIDMLGRAGVSFASHTVSHPILTQCDAETLREELFGSRHALETSLGCKILHFAYPNGDWNEEVKDAVRSAGYSTARTIRPGFISAHSDPLALPNLGVSDDASLNKAILQASGLWYLLKKVRRFKSVATEYGA
ncbi:hypothetical protein GCM10010960_05240 [Arenimonas maotaiensis]|uniref:NodB homology domain-containing protein n=1 Tax=Arenimonas maotaiensis TaxID=1446479 RepID=A0A917CEU6_9GAMM|nr:polysaccharide deacetylase family protein [Arenimonas maotaiensis]GGF86180.1 hypothetical protein GCM10010960_05240 [Arenimonas maotaiensis]